MPPMSTPHRSIISLHSRHHQHMPCIGSIGCLGNADSHMARFLKSHEALFFRASTMRTRISASVAGPRRDPPEDTGIDSDEKREDMSSASLFRALHTHPLCVDGCLGHVACVVTSTECSDSMCNLHESHHSPGRVSKPSLSQGAMFVSKAAMRSSNQPDMKPILAIPSTGLMRVLHLPPLCSYEYCVHVEFLSHAARQSSIDLASVSSLSLWLSQSISTSVICGIT